MQQASGLPEPTRNVPRDGGRGRQRLPDTQTCTKLDKLELPGYQQDYRSLTGFTANTIPCTNQSSEHHNSRYIKNKPTRSRRSLSRTHASSTTPLEVTEKLSETTPNREVNARIKAASNKIPDNKKNWSTRLRRSLSRTHESNTTTYGVTKNLARPPPFNRGVGLPITSEMQR